MSGLEALHLAARSASPADFWFWAGGCALSAAAAAWFLVRSLKRIRLIEDTPTSRVRSAAQGYVELSGTVDVLAGPPIIAPLTGTPCAWYRYRVERRAKAGEKGRLRWTTVASGVSHDLFLLRDETGRCVVDPEGAEVLARTRQTWYGSAPLPRRPPPMQGRWFHRGKYRYTEHRLHPGETLYAAGWFRTEDAQADTGLREAVAVLLRAWKRNPDKALQAYDHNRNGRFELDEWEAVRRAARREVLRRRAEAARGPRVHLLARPTDGRPYLLSALPEALLVRRYRRAGCAAFVALAVFGTTAAWLLLARFTA